jgi:tight adherence protein C
MTELIAQNLLLKLALLAGLFALVMAATYLVASAIGRRQVMRQRLVGDGDPVSLRSDLPDALRVRDTSGAWIKLVNAVERAGVSLVDTKDQILRTKLIAAGYKAPHAPRVYTLIRLMLVIGLPLALFAWISLSGSSPSIIRLYFTLIVAAAAGLYVPALFISAKAGRRQETMINSFPDALDLMLVCVEAGLGIEAAFARVGQEMTASHPLLAEQLGLVVLELRAGRSREDALRRMADRSGADEIRAFATLLIQSTKLGSSIAQTLRVYATEMRERRRMRAEEKAHRLPVLLSIPLVACMLPVMIGVLMLPAAIRVVRTIIPALHGG